MELNIDFVVVCDSCGSVLKAHTWGDEIIVEPCEECMNRSFKDGKHEEE